MRREGKDQWPDKHLSGTSDGLLRLLGKSVRGKTVTPTELPRWGRGATIRQVRGVLSLKETQKSGAHFASRKKQKRRGKPTPSQELREAAPCIVFCGTPYGLAWGSQVQLTSMFTGDKSGH